MINHENQIEGQGEEYRKFHDQEYEQSFRSQFPKLSHKLNTINKVAQWNN